jgi:hypothetical protein
MEIGDSIVLVKEDKNDLGLQLNNISWQLVYNEQREKADSAEATVSDQGSIAIKLENMPLILRGTFISEKLVRDTDTNEVIGVEKVEAQSYDSVSPVILKPKASVSKRAETRLRLTDNDELVDDSDGHKLSENEIEEVLQT